MRIAATVLAGALGIGIAGRVCAFVVVEEVPLGFGGEQAGLEVGDVIESWSRPPHPPANPRAARGAIRTAFDLSYVDVEQGPRAPVTLTGRRAGRRRSWTLPVDEWRLVARPPLSKDLAARHEAAQRQAADGRASEAGEAWTEAAAIAEREGERSLAAWLLRRAGAVLARSRLWPAADEAYARAVALLDGPRTRREASSLLGEWAETFGWRANRREANARYERALRLQEEVEPSSLTAARIFRALGDGHYFEPAAAEAWYRRSLELRERLAPESAVVADSLSSLGRLRLVLEDPAAGEDLARAVRIREAVMPEGQPLALDRSGLATALTLKGDYGEASLQLRRALSVLERAAPSSAEHAHALFTAGRLARITGDLAGAERDYRRSLQIYEKLFPNGLAVGTGLRALSIVAWDRRDFAAAESRAKQALAIEERLTPGTPRVSELVHHLGDIALDSGDAAGAEPYFRRALALNEARAPEGREAASDLRCLSLALARSGRLDEAETQARRSLELRRRQAPSSIHMSRSLVALGEIAMLQGRALDSEGFYQQALAITTRLIPASREEAQAHYGLGRALRRAGRRVEAAEALARATAALERAQARVGGGAEAQGGFSAAYSRYYQEEIEVLMELGRPDDAFAVIERSRARSRLALLGARAGAFMADLPTAVARARQQNQAAYDRAQAELTALDPETQQAEIERGLARLRELRDENAEILAQVRVASPRLAALHAPKPLDVTEARASLDPGDALLSFAVGEAETFVFVLTPESEEYDRRLTVFKVPLSEEKLRRTVESFRRSIERGDALDLVRAQAADLYDRLLRPVDAMLVRCRRAAVSADGPLHLLPFAALLRTEPHGRLESGRWLAQWLPTHSVGSATQYAELKKARRAITPAEMKLAAFGDPRSTAVPPLPHSRHEVEAIVAAFGKQVVAYLGEEATEARVKDGLQAFSHLHFACHGVLDERYPLHSALVLSAPADLVEGQENGMLQVWEILDGVRLDADLVTLSGCNTALGREMGGEGLLGLTRAFQYAGARSVLASLWAVGDESTAELMRRFYGHVKAGKDKADALRAAQIELISGALTETTGDETSRGVGARVQVSGRDGAHPFRWASFQLVGDWR